MFVVVNQTVLYPAQDGESPSFVQFKINNSIAAQNNQQVRVKFGENLGFPPGNRSWNCNPGHPYVEGMLTSRQGYDELLVYVENGYEVIVDIQITHYCRHGCSCTPVYGTVNPVHFPVTKNSTPCPFSGDFSMTFDNDTTVGSGAISNYPTFPVVIAVIAILVYWCVA